MVHDRRYVWLDLIRGLSAIIVCAGHLRAAMFVDNSNFPVTSVIGKLFYFITSLGHQSVIVFFVLSGFFVGGSVMNRKLNFSLLEYLKARLIRLWGVLIPALIFTAFIDLYLLDSNALTGIHYDALNSGPSGNYSTSIGTFFANVGFLQTIYFPVFGSNGPLWSLANEFWYYILFPLIAIVIGYLKATIFYRVASGIFILFITFLFIQSILEGFVVWLMGVLVFCVYKKQSVSSNYLFVVVGSFFFAFTLIDSKLGLIHSNIMLSSDLLVAIALSLFIVSLNGVDAPPKISKTISIVSKWISEISYSLYLFHFPVIMLIYTNFYAEKQVTWGLYGVIQYMFWLFILLLGGVIFWWLFERNTTSVKNWLTEQQVKGFARFQK